MSSQSSSLDKLLHCLTGLLEDENNVFGEKVTNICNGWKERCKVVSYLWWLNKKLGDSVAVLATAVEILDRFLGIVKVQWKYMKCVAVASYFIALDVVEDDKDLPDIESLIERGNCSFSNKDVRRMENIIRTKLSGNLRTPTPFDFLELIVDLLCIQHKDAIELEDIHNEAFFGELCNLLQMCLCACKFSRYKNSTLAVSVVSVVVAKYVPDWFTVHAPIMNLLKTTTVDFLQCREIVKNAALIKKFSKHRRRQNVSKCPSLTPIIENPFEREYSLHCEREALKEVKDSSVNALLSPERNNPVKKPNAEIYLSRLCDDQYDILPAAKRPRRGMCNVAQECTEDGNEVISSKTVNCLR